MIKNILYCLVFIFFVECTNNSQSDKNHTTSPDSITQLQTNSSKQDKTGFSESVLKNSTLRADGKECNVSYYIPARKTDEVLPVVFLFDPQGSGNTPVNMYRSLADSLKIIIVGSNDLKNGMRRNDIQINVSTLISVTSKELPVDTSQIIFCGFSGGGRIAVEQGKLYSNIKSIISSGAANTPEGFGSRNYFIVAGNEDFNYMECREVAAKYSNTTLFTEFDGGHEWPPLATMFPIIRNIIYTSQYQHIPTTISNDELFLFAFEKSEQEKIKSSYGNESIDWWIGYFDKLETVEKDTDREKVKQAKRLKNFISMYSYFYCLNAVQQNNTDLLKYCLIIYKKSDPENPDLYFFSCCYNAMNGNIESALLALEKAIDAGFKDKNKLLETPQLKPVQSNDRFWILLDGM